MFTNKKVALLGGNAKPALDLDFSKTPQIDSRLTFTRSTTASVVDNEGLNKTAKINEVRFAGARRVENICSNSSNFSNGSWSAGSATVASGISDPFGGTGAFTLTSTAASGYFIGTSLASLANEAHVIVSSIWIRRRTGTGIISIQVGTSAIAITAAVTGSWQRVSALHSYASSNSNLKININISGDAFDIYQAQVESVIGQVNQNPSEYVSVGVLSYPYQGAGVDGVKYFTTTNGNTVSNNVVTEAVGTPLTNGITLLAEEARTNLLLNSATPATQNITTTAQTYTISMWGTGTGTLTGTATGTLTGTGAANRVSLTVTATAGALTLTFAGTNTNGQCEAGPTMSSYIATAGAAVTRTADSLSFTGAGLNSWYNPTQGTFAITASGSAFNAPYNLGALALTYASQTKYLLGYNNNAKNGSTFLYTAATLGSPVEYTGVSVPTTIYINSGGIANISKFTYYQKAIKSTKMDALL